MTPGAILIAMLRFAGWEAALFAASIRLARFLEWENAAEEWLAVLAIEVTLESSIAAAFSFARINSQAAYWVAAAVCGLAVLGVRRFPAIPGKGLGVVPILGALAAPLMLLSFRPVEEIDSINYLHYLIEWMANRATPYVFATNYVAFWELSFLPAWTVTRVDLFFPPLALKAVVLLGLAAWLVGRELGIGRTLLSVTVFGSLLMRHYWYEYSGVPTLKNDVLHGVGFVLLTLVMVRAVRGKLRAADVVLLSFGAAFAAVKYTGIFFAVIAAAVVLWRGAGRRLAVAIGVPLFLLATSGHYYLHNFLLYGSPFYPFQINLGFIHLPGTADLSYSSILYNLHDARLWRALFLPAGGVSPAGLLFPAILAGALVAGAWKCWHAGRNACGMVAFCILCGWLLYFRSVYSACAAPGDLGFILNSLNSVRYVDGVLAVSELFLVALMGRFVWLAAGLVAVNAVSRLAILYGKESYPPMLLIAVAGLALVLLVIFKNRFFTVAALLVFIGGPFVVELNRSQWTTYWNDLKPAIQGVRGKDLAELAVPDGGYFAGHVVAAGNPVDPAVRSLLPEEVVAAPPRYLAVLVTPGSEAGGGWQARYGAQLSAWGYQTIVKSLSGALLERPGIPLK
ncbi:MAG TPA: hypothetical protein VE959_06265 [Bryobacteraceae bacterium]|nr:hypothetical protein [Bryobacteraceae bacterium]